MALRQVFVLALHLAAIISFAKSDDKPLSPEEEEDLKKLADASNYFGLNMYQQLVKQTSDNIFFSPLSISTAMGMLFEGARGKSQQELQQTLGYDKAGLTKEKVPPTFKNLLESLSNKDNKDYILDNANALYIDNNQQVKEEFVKEAKNYFKAVVENVDFANDNKNVVNKINNFVNDATHGKIPHFVDELDPSTVMFLLNAVYFLGNWVNQFDERLTKERTFYNDGDSSKTSQIKMMHIEKNFPYSQEADSQVLELPYKGNRISMIVILPNERGGLSSAENQLNSDTFKQILKKLQQRKVKVTLPKFKIQYSNELSSAIAALGAGSIFGPGVNLTGISQKNNLKVSEIQHKAIVEVDEKGSEAAAATGIGIATMAVINENFVPDFVADHPFIFAIVDKKTEMIEFVGRIKNM